jgi:hypothetical protein
MGISRRAVLAGLAGVCARGAQPGLRVGVFQSDATPEMGEPLIWVDPTKQVLDPLLAKGVVIEAPGRRIVLCALDWCGIGNATHLLFRTKLAQAAGTGIENVSVHTLHQHTAPYVDGDAYAIMRKLPKVPLLMSDAFLARVTDRLAAAVQHAASRMQPFDSVGTGQTRVERVASARRFVSSEGKAVTRYSTGGKDPKMAALPEGDIDPALRTVTLAAGSKPIVRLHYYATHPQTWCCDGRVSGDVIASARAAVEKDEGIPQVYFTGCSGDVTVGKYNNGTPEAKNGLSERLAQGMKASARSTRFAPAGQVAWRRENLPLPPKVRPPAKTVQELDAAIASGKLDDAELYRSSINLAFARRKRPLETAVLEIGNVSIVHLPGEPMVEFQKYALGLRPERFVTVAGYGDIAPGYLCTDRAVQEGGYEPGASNAGPGVEAALKSAIRKLLT